MVATQGRPLGLLGWLLSILMGMAAGRAVTGVPRGPTADRTA